MPTAAQIAEEVAAGPLAAELAPLWAAGDDAGVAAALSRRDLPGYVPARAVVVALSRALRWGIVPLAVLHRKLPDGSDCPVDLYGLLATVQLAAYSTIDPPLRLEVGPLSVTLAAIPDALIPADTKAAILAAEVKLSRAEAAWGYGASVSAGLVGEARNNG